MSETVTVICKLPNGFDMVVGNKIVKLNGLNTTTVYGATEAYTEVEKSFFDAWLPENKNRSWCTSQAISYRENLKEAKAKAKDLKSVKTGLEPVEQDQKV